MFTFIGPILIAVNPYQRLPIFEKEFMKMYFDQVLKNLAVAAAHHPCTSDVRITAAAFERGSFATTPVPSCQQGICTNVEWQKESIYGHQR